MQVLLPKFGLVPQNSVTFFFTNNLLIPVVVGCVVAQCCSFHPFQLFVGTKPPSAPCLLLSTAVTSWKMGVPFLSTSEQLPTLVFAFAATSGQNYFESGCYTALFLGLKVHQVLVKSPGTGFSAGFCGSSQSWKLSTRSGAAQKV